MSQASVTLSRPSYMRCVVQLPEVEVPETLVRARKIGQWHLDRVPPMRRVRRHPVIFQRGYWSGLGWEPCFWRLKDGAGKVWMTTSRMERESHSLHLKHARGDVVVAGAGLGMILFNLVQKREVRTVVAIERDKDLLDFCRSQSETWKGGAKVRWLLADAREVTRTTLSRLYQMQEPPTYFYADIWKGMDEEGAVADVQLMNRNVGSMMTGWWAQELAFIRWCARNGVKRAEVTVETFDDWCLDIGLTVPERSEAYLRYCFAVALNVTLQ